METKLTLRLRKSVIDRAKQYAHKQNTSLSKIIESYLDYLTKSEKKETEITPLVKSLSGVIDLKEDYDYKEDYAEYLSNKYQ